MKKEVRADHLFQSAWGIAEESSASQDLKAGSMPRQRAVIELAMIRRATLGRWACPWLFADSSTAATINHTAGQRLGL